jgi:hypothetical protein
MYLVMSVKTELEIDVDYGFSQRATVPLLWSPGMFGACPVFETREDAERYADGDAEVIKVSPSSLKR